MWDLKKRMVSTLDQMQVPNGTELCVRISKFNYTSIADRLRTVSKSNYSHQTGVVNQFTGSTFPLFATVV